MTAEQTSQLQQAITGALKYGRSVEEPACYDGIAIVRHPDEIFATILVGGAEPFAISSTEGAINDFCDAAMAYRESGSDPEGIVAEAISIAIENGNSFGSFLEAGK